MSLASSPVLTGPSGSLLDLIGNTPMVEVTRLDTGPCRLFLKLEAQNPGGSIKDRIALSMIAAAEREGWLKPGGTIVEATAGNTGLALTLVGQAKGYRVLLVIPDKMSREKIQHLRAMGADVRLTRSDVPHGHPDYYTDMAERLAQQIPGGFYVNQFANAANTEAHVRAGLRRAVAGGGDRGLTGRGARHQQIFDEAGGSRTDRGLLDAADRRLGR